MRHEVVAWRLTKSLNKICRPTGGEIEFTLSYLQISQQELRLINRVCETILANEVKGVVQQRTVAE